MKAEDFEKTLKIRRRKFIILILMSFMITLLIVWIIHALMFWPAIMTYRGTIIQNYKTDLMKLVVEKGPEMNPEIKKILWKKAEAPYTDNNSELSSLEWYTRASVIFLEFLCAILIVLMVAFQKTNDPDTLFSEMGPTAKLKFLGKLEDDVDVKALIKEKLKKG